jgi:glycosyltransferase involved in cell wall biosynthesis
MRILHVFRSPVGGLFRHVCDLVRGQHLLGHEVGVICDSSTGGAAAEAALAALAAHCSLGITRRKISTLPGLGDLAGRNAVLALARQIGVDVLHGHGAKGGAYARLAAQGLKLPAAYTAHGGSLHYEWLKLPGAAFLAAEKALRFKGTGLIFVCEFERQLYDRKIGLGGCPSAVVYNGLGPEDFAPRVLAPDAAELFFIGEMRELKGVDVLLQALALIPEVTRPRLNLIGEGRDMAAFQALAGQLDLGEKAQFLGRKDFRTAASRGRVMVMPSRNESFPYVVLEALAAGVPIIASKVGGIPEALPEASLVPIGDSAALASAIERAVANSPILEAEAAVLRNAAQVRLDAKIMAKAICEFYQRLR